MNEVDGARRRPSAALSEIRGARGSTAPGGAASRGRHATKPTRARSAHTPAGWAPHAQGSRVALVALPVHAGDFDGSKLLICAPVEALDCAPRAACDKSTPEEVGAPAFFRIDFAAKALVGPKRTASIELIEKTEEQILLQGTELGYAWTVVLDVRTGRMASSLANREGVFVLFGACTIP